MPRLLFNFKCANGHSSDHFVETTIQEEACPECDEKATRQLSSPHFPIGQGCDPDMPTASARWERMHRGTGSGKITDSMNDSCGGARPQDVRDVNNPD